MNNSPVLALNQIGIKPLVTAQTGAGLGVGSEFNFMDYLLNLQSQQPESSIFDLLTADSENPLADGAALPQRKEEEAPTAGVWGDLLPVFQGLETQGVSKPVLDCTVAADRLLDPAQGFVTESMDPAAERKVSEPVVKVEEAFSVSPRQFVKLSAEAEKASPLVSAETITGLPKNEDRIGKTSPGLVSGHKHSALQLYKELGASSTPRPQESTLRSVETSDRLSTKVGAVSDRTPSVEVGKAEKKGLDREIATRDERVAILQGLPMATGAHELGKAEKGARHGEPLSVPELFSRVESLASQGGGKMTVSLTPPELGHIEIHVTTKGNQVEVEMRSENPGAKSVIEGSLSELRHSLEQHDLNLTRVEVFTARDSGAGFNQHSELSWSRQQQQQNNDSPYSGGRSLRADEIEASSAGARAHSMGNVSKGGRHSAVDMRI